MPLTGDPMRDGHPTQDADCHYPQLTDPHSASPSSRATITMSEIGRLIRRPTVATAKSRSRTISLDHQNVNAARVERIENEALIIGLVGDWRLDGGLPLLSSSIGALTSQPHIRV